MLRRIFAFLALPFACFVSNLAAHDETRVQALRRLAVAEERALAQADVSATKLPAEQLAKLTIRVFDSEAVTPVAALVRITNVADGKAIRLAGEIHRAENWYSLDAGAVVQVPRRKLKVETLLGLETELSVREVDLTNVETAAVDLKLRRLANRAKQGSFAGNTHLHLRNLTWEEMDRYLRLVPRSDGLAVVFVSHLLRADDDRNYITNQLTTGDLGRLSQSGVLFGNGEEHRHNFGAGGEGYGHVMFLNIQRLIEPVSIGPGIMKQGTDGRPLRIGIEQARRDGATVIWCHNRFGLEDVPNWLAETLHAQNINDGGPHGSYDETFYRYLNLGMRVPFSTGTDWFVYDFSRVYVPVSGELSSSKWLKQLAAGRTSITNGPLLEFEVDGHSIGEVLSLAQKRTLRIRGRGLGRLDFVGLELICNGHVVKSSATKSVNGHFESEMNWEVSVSEPSWFALRIPLEQGKNELGQTLFAHTSPIYCDFAGKRVFQASAAEPLLAELQRAVTVIPAKGLFANDTERKQVLDVYHEAIKKLRSRIEKSDAAAK